MLRSGFLLVTLLFAVPPAAFGQERITFHLGAGITPRTNNGYGVGAHLLGGVSLWAGPLPLGIRFDGVASIARQKYFGFLLDEDTNGLPRMIDRGYRPIAGGSLSLALARRSGTTRPYGYAGLGYYESPWSYYYSWKHKLGPTFGLGLDREVSGHNWFLELSVRVFGNTFARDSDRSLVPLTFGVTF